MKRLLLALSLGLAALLPAPKAECAWCATHPCYAGGGCNMGCVCMTEPGQTAGRCVSFQ